MNAALKEAMISKDARRRDVIRMALNAVKQVEIDERKTLTPEDVTAILQREAKTRREAIAEAQNAGRAETAAAEAEKLAILESFLPQQMTRDEVAVLARDAIVQTGATSPKDMGKVMSVLMPKVKGVADGKLVNDVVREMLSTG
jgi:uncharacterized protein YqeY